MKSNNELRKKNGTEKREKERSQNLAKISILLCRHPKTLQYCVENKCK